jgi:hypothetical protein
MNKTKSSRVVGNRIGKLWVEKYLSPITIKPLLQQAKEMEKEQIVDAFEDGKWDSLAFKATPNEQYYEQKYKGNK